MAGCFGGEMMCQIRLYGLMDGETKGIKLYKDSKGCASRDGDREGENDSQIHGQMKGWMDRNRWKDRWVEDR